MENQQYTQEDEIDLSQYIKVIAKRKKTLIAVFLLVLAIGIINILFSPKIYRISMMIQPPVVGQSLTGANDLEPAENLRGMIVSGAYDGELKKILNMDLEKNNLDFKVLIPSKTNILQVSVDLGNNKKESGIILLRNLANLISGSYAKSIEAITADIVSQIKSNERAIIGAKEKAKNLQEQIKEVTVREDKLREEIKIVNENTAQILLKREGLLKNNVTTENVLILLLTNFIQNNTSYSNQLNNQFSELSIRRVNLNLELKNTDSQISGFEMAIDQLSISKSFISNLKIIAQPRVSPSPINPSKKKALVTSIVMGLFLGVLAIFLQEFWMNNFMKK